MSRIVVTSAAFWGDVMPFVPIARELAARGHDVTYALPVDHHAMLAREPFALADLGSTFSPDAVMRDARQRRLIEQRGLRLSGAQVARYWTRRYIVDELDQVVGTTRSILDGADLMLTHPTTGTLTAIAADAEGVPWVTGHLFPMMLPTARRAPSTFPVPQLPGRLGRAVNRGAWSAGLTTTSTMMYDRAINAYRAECGLPRRRANVLLAGVSRLRTLMLVSPRYCEPPGDWPPSVRMTGFTLWDGSQPVPREVQTFLDAGDPPVLVTLGTCAAATARRVFPAIADALDALGLRGLFLVAHEENREVLGDRPGVFTFAPLSPVLARCRAIVHAGSHGTNAAALAAGVPSVCVPILFDQLWHGRRVEELGVGRLVADGARRPRRIAAAISGVVRDADTSRRARALASRLAEERGVQAACDEVETVLAGG